jgi:hypothetical protein
MARGQTEGDRTATGAGIGLALAALATAGCLGGLLNPSARVRVSRGALPVEAADSFVVAAPPAEPVAAALFSRINEDRRRAGLSRLLWDPLAAEIAHRYTLRQVLERSYGHYLADGVPPYARLAFGGVLAFAAENTAAFSSTGGPLENSALELAAMAHEQMLAERPPDDGHRRAIFDPDATHLGIGWTLDGTQFRLDEEFLVRRFERLEVRSSGPAGRAVFVGGQSRPGAAIAFITVARQALPRPIPREEAQSRHSYSYPSASSALIPASALTSGFGLRSHRAVVTSLDGRFSFRYLFDDPGLWTFVLYFQRAGEPAPHPGGSITLVVREEKGSGTSD